MLSIRKRRLNGWQRIGVVASFVWAIGGAFWGFSVGYNEYGLSVDYYQCTAGAQNWFENQDQYPNSRRYTRDDLERDLGKCAAENLNAQKEASLSGALYAVLLALLPIPLGWLAVYKLIALLRWIREGFVTPP